MNIKRKLREKLTEAKYIVNPEDLDTVVDKMGDSDTVKIVDENSEEIIDGETEENNVSEYNFIKPKMTKKEIQETVLKYLNNEK